MKKPPSLYWDVKDACAARTKGNGEVLEALTETVDAESQASLPSETIPSTTGDAESFDMPERHGSAPTNSETPSESDWVMVEIADNEHQASAETHQVFENGDMHAGNKRKHEEASGGTDEDTSDDESELTSTLPSTRGVCYLSRESEKGTAHYESMKFPARGGREWVHGQSGARNKRSAPLHRMRRMLQGRSPERSPGPHSPGSS